MEAVPAGWYPDPQGVAGERYHDGSDWTSQTRQAVGEPSKSSPQSTRGRGIAIFRIVALVLLLALAFVVAISTLTSKPNEYTVGNSEALISAALSDYEANNALAESAPQQQVVNGWVTRDLLSIIARQNVNALEAQTELATLQSRTNQLLSGLLIVLVLLVGGVAVVGATVVGRGQRNQ